MEASIDQVRFLSRSETRARLMELLHREGPLSRDEIRTTLDASRTTVQRNLEALVDQEWLTRSGQTYAVAPCGELVVEDFLALGRTMEITDRLRPFLQHVDSAAFDFDLRLLSDADLVTPEPGNPRAMETRHVSRIRQSDRARKLLPVTGTQAVSVSRDRVIDGGASMEIVVTDEIADIYRTNPDFLPAIEEMHGTDRYSLGVTSTDVPFYLGILDDHVQIAVSEAGDPRALVETTNPEIREWAERTLDAYATDAEPFRSETS